MDSILSVAVVLLILLGFILLIRWLGAWMLRIDTVISLQKETLKTLKENQNCIKPKANKAVKPLSNEDKARLYDEMDGK
jgi:uncharacterized membrane protein